MTENQLLNNHIFKEIRQFYTLFKEVVIPQIWNGLATTSSGYHFFMKVNSPAFYRDGILTDPMKVRLSMGKLTLPEGMQAQRTSTRGTSIEVKWERDFYLPGKSSQDKLMVISTGEGNYSAMAATGLTRGDRVVTFELPELAVPATHIYLFFESLDQRYYSDSICLEI